MPRIPSWSAAMTNQPFFNRDRDAFIPTDAARGPWDPNSLHGRVIIGLLAFAIEQRHGGDDFVPARLTVDMFRLPTLAPIEVKTRLVRDGQARCGRRRTGMFLPRQRFHRRPIHGLACTASGPPGRSSARWAHSARDGSG